MKVNLVVSKPIQITNDIGDKVFKTTLTHPKLNGQLSFIHGETNRDETLMAVANSLSDDINEIMRSVEELTKK